MTDLREKIARAIASVHDKHEGIWRHCLPEADVVITVLREQEPVAWAATDESGHEVEALGFNKSNRFDTPLYMEAPIPPCGIEGWQWVPVEPTAMMLSEMFSLGYLSQHRAYAAMLEAAPKPGDGE